MPKLFIGIDGGATKTIAHVEDEAGMLLGIGKSGPANIRWDTDGAWRSIQTAVTHALESTGITWGDRAYDWFCGAGLAGTQVPSACDHFLSLAHPFKHLALHSDGYVSCVGAHQGGDGAVIAIGTGVVAYQIEGDIVTRVSGWGFPQGDEGSGAWLGLQAVRQTLHAHDHRQPHSPLTDAVLAHFNENFTEFIIWANGATSKDFAALAPLVIGLATKEEPSAIALMQQAAQEIDRIWSALVAQQRKRLDCCLLGGIAPFIEPYLNPDLRAHLKPPQADAAAGALLMIRRQVAAN